MKKVYGVLSSAALIGMILTGCGEAEVTQVNDNGQETKSDQKAKKEKKVYKVGDSVSVDGMEVTIKKAAIVKPDEYTPVEKDQVLRLEITAKNNSVDNGFVDTTDFSVYTGDDKAEEYYGHDLGSIGGELKQGKSMNLKVEFDISEADTIEVFYEPTFTLKENAEVKFEIPAGDLK